MATVEQWSRLAGVGPMDDRCARIAPTLRERMGIAELMPSCVLCGRQVVLRDNAKPGPAAEPPQWVTIARGEQVCFTSPPGPHRVPPLSRELRVAA